MENALCVKGLVNMKFIADGGFRYEWRNETYTYLAEAYLYEI